MVSRFEKAFFSFFEKVEAKGKAKQKQKILPRYVLKHRIKIVSDGRVVFDSEDYKKEQIPIDVQYTIMNFGYPEKKEMKKEPLVYNLTSDALPVLMLDES